MIKLTPRGMSRNPADSAGNRRRNETLFRDEPLLSFRSGIRTFLVLFSPRRRSIRPAFPDARRPRQR
jgi:hypothetical protein